MSAKLPKPKVAEIIVKVSTFFWIYLATRLQLEISQTFSPFWIFTFFQLPSEIERTFGAFPAHLGVEAMAKLCRNKSLNCQFPWPLARYYHQIYLSTLSIETYLSNIFEYTVKCIWKYIDKYWHGNLNWKFPWHSNLFVCILNM